jgi:hypothetical protein
MYVRLTNVALQKWSHSDSQNQFLTQKIGLYKCAEVKNPEKGRFPWVNRVGPNLIIRVLLWGRQRITVRERKGKNGSRV